MFFFSVFFTPDLYSFVYHILFSSAPIAFLAIWTDKKFMGCSTSCVSHQGWHGDWSPSNRRSITLKGPNSTSESNWSLKSSESVNTLNVCCRKELPHGYACNCHWQDLNVLFLPNFISVHIKIYICRYILFAIFF